MIQPQEFSHSWLPHYMSKLHKSMYDLKQAPRNWYTKLLQFLVSLGLSLFKMDVSIFIFNSCGIVAYFLVYVDDIILTGNNDKSSIATFNVQLGSTFSTIGIGDLTFFLSIQVKRLSSGQDLNMCLIFWIKHACTLANFFRLQWRLVTIYTKRIV